MGKLSAKDFIAPGTALRTRGAMAYTSATGEARVMPEGTVAVVAEASAGNTRFRVRFYPAGVERACTRAGLLAACEPLPPRHPGVPDPADRALVDALAAIYARASADKAAGRPVALLPERLVDDLVGATSWREVGAAVRAVLFHAGERTRAGLVLDFEDLDRVAALSDFPERLADAPAAAADTPGGREDAGDERPAPAPR